MCALRTQVQPDTCASGTLARRSLPKSDTDAQKQVICTKTNARDSSPGLRGSYFQYLTCSAQHSEYCSNMPFHTTILIYYAGKNMAGPLAATAQMNRKPNCIVHYLQGSVEKPMSLPPIPIPQKTLTDVPQRDACIRVVRRIKTNPIQSPTLRAISSPQL